MNVLRVNEHDDVFIKSTTPSSYTDVTKMQSHKDDRQCTCTMYTTSTVPASTAGRHPQLKTMPTTAGTQIEQTRIHPSQQTSKENVNSSSRVN